MYKLILEERSYKMLVLQYLNDKAKHEIEFNKNSDHVVTIKGALPAKTDGFTLSRKGFNDNWDYSAYNTIYRIIDDGIQFSNDGSEYEPPKKNVEVSISWNDGDDLRKIRPLSIAVRVLKNGEELEIIKLSSGNDWKYVYENVLAEDDYTVESENVMDYDKEISGTHITYSTEVPTPSEPTIDDLSEAIAEIYDIVSQNSSDIIDTQEAVAEIYEMIGE